MKKIYLLGLVSMFALAANAQTTLKIANPLKTKSVRNEKITSPDASRAVTTAIICNTQYVAGTTMDLNLTYTATNADGEYVDFLQLTFPTGITPTGLAATSNPFPNTEDPAGGLEALNPVAGQVISWGVNNNDQYGGVFSSTGISFTINVTVAAGLTGNKTVSYLASGDGFSASPADFNGTFIIYPAGAALVNLNTVFIQPNQLTAINVCNYGVDTLVAQIKNNGTTTESNITATYSVNGVAQPATVIPGPLAPGDSTYVFWLPGFDFTGSNSYDLVAWTSAASDIDLTNDTAKLTFTNSMSYALTSSTYTNGCEAGYEYNSLNRVVVSGDGYVFGPSGATFFAGAQALFYTVPNTATVGIHEAMVILPCMDVVAGETYRISYYKRINGSATTANGMSGVFTGLLNTAAAMTTALKPYAALTTYATWIKDSVDYTATASETRYFALGGKGAVVAGSNQINVRYDNINISKVTSVGVNENVSTDLVSIFPNPNSGVFTINAIEVNASVIIYSIIGEHVYSSPLTKGNNTINLSHLAAGSYFVKVNNDGKIVTKRLVINK